MKPQLLLFKPSQLTPHPKNMRRFYPADQVQEMADSIAANNGVLEPLIITKQGGKWLVVDGNMRLAGAKLLGAKCPELECKVVEKNEAEQKLAMIVANNIRYEVDPVSEGIHYKSLKDEGLTVREISRRTGAYEIRIAKRLVLAELDEPIQQLITDGKLPADERSAKALLRLTSSVRIKLAKRLAENKNTKIETIIKACEALAGGKKPIRKMKRPAVELAAIEGQTGKIKGLRLAAKEACHKCNQYEDVKDKTLEPAWTVVMHKADETCGKCPLKEMQNVCGTCPAVELLRRLVPKAA